MRKTKAFKTFLEQSMSDTFVGNDELLWDSRTSPAINELSNVWTARTERLQYGRSANQKKLFVAFPSTPVFQVVPWNDLSVVMYMTHDLVKDMLVAEEWIDVKDMRDDATTIVHYVVYGSVSTGVKIYRIDSGNKSIVECVDDLPKGVYTRIGILCLEVIRRLHKHDAIYISRNVRFCDSVNTNAYTLQTLLSNGLQTNDRFDQMFRKWVGDVWSRIEFQFNLYTK